MAAEAPNTDRTGAEGGAGLSLHLDRCGDWTALRRALEASGYTEEALTKDVIDGDSGRPIDLPIALRATAKPSPYHTLARLFTLARAVGEAAAREALAPMSLEELLDAGLLRRCPEGIRSQVALLPGEGVLLARDFWPDFVGSRLEADWVMGASPSSRWAARLVVRRAGERALDLGTGSGYLALLAARHAAHVVATDVNPRALAIAALSARLNGMANIEVRQGSLYEPVAGEAFDLVMSNPPYVISPESQYQYRDGGLPGDSLAERLIREAPAHLAEGGFCSIVFDWYHERDDDWAERPRRWVEAAGCDAWLLRARGHSPLSYSAMWLSSGFPARDAGQMERTLDAWLAYYERLGIRRLSSGVFILRRRTARSHWFHADEMPKGWPENPCSSQIQRVFAAHDLLADLGGDRRLLGLRFVLTPEHRLVQFLHAEEGHWCLSSAHFAQTEGMSFVGNIDQFVSSLLAGCDGTRTLGELAADLAKRTGADPEKVGPSAAAVFRKFLETGFLTVAKSDEKAP